MSARSDICIGPFEDGDTPALVGLVRELQAHEVTLFDRMLPPDEIGAGYVAALRQQCRDHAGEILIARSGGDLIGYAVILTSVAQDDPDEVAYTYASIPDIAVAAGHRGHGIGKRLIAECERRAVAAGARWLRITALAGNARALALYRGHGFADHLVELEKPI